MDRSNRPLLAGLIVLALNSLYLAARSDASLFYFANLGAHLVLGLAVAAAGARLVRRHWTALPVLLRMASAAFAGASVFGAFLMVVGATRPFRWALWTHMLLAALAALLGLVHGLRSVRPAAARLAMATACLLALLAPLARYGADRFPEQSRIVNPTLPPDRMEGEGAGPGSPFFPSSSETNVGGIIPATFFMTSQTCGRCHKDIYDQWNASVHHFSSFNNQWYRKSIEYMQDVVGTTPTRSSSTAASTGRSGSRSTPPRPRTGWAAFPATPSSM